MPSAPNVRAHGLASTGPTHGSPMTDREREFKPSKGWIGGPRFVFVSTNGSHSTNSGTHKRKKAKPSVLPERRTIVPKWAEKYRSAA